MKKRLDVVLVDDDATILQLIKELYENSEIINIKHSYQDSTKFIAEAPSLSFDLCLLDIDIPITNGLVVAQLLKDKPYIFITGTENKLKEALGLTPIDVIIKPFTKTRLDHALQKTYKLLSENIEEALFNVAESSRKIKIHLADIIYIHTDDYDSRNKQVILKDGTKYTIMNCFFDELLDLARNLVQVNKNTLVSIDAIHDVAYDVLSVKSEFAKIMPKEITIGKVYKAEFKKRIFYK